jgi:hypothetical protein
MTSINIRQKGANAERDLAIELNAIVNLVLKERGFPMPAKPIIQRNQNQSAVGGSDLTFPIPIALEVKRQEQLSINTWWKQCEVAAQEFGGVPVLIYRQSRKPWTVVMYVDIPVGSAAHLTKVRATLSFEDFKAWLRVSLTTALNNGTWVPVA